MAAERDIEKNEAQGNILFDESGSMLLYSTMLGVKIVNINNGKVVQTIGKQENLRLLKIALYQVRNLGFKFSWRCWILKLNSRANPREVKLQWLSKWRRLKTPPLITLKLIQFSSALPSKRTDSTSSLGIFYLKINLLWKLLKNKIISGESLLSQSRWRVSETCSMKSRPRRTSLLPRRSRPRSASTAMPSSTQPMGTSTSRSSARSAPGRWRTSACMPRTATSTATFSTGLSSRSWFKPEIRQVILKSSFYLSH